MKKLPSYLILAIIALAIYGTYGLVSAEWYRGQICPTIVKILACYIIFDILIAALLSHLIITRWSYMIYFTVTSIALSIATYGSLDELMGFPDCPYTSDGTPMCYISFGIFSSLLILKYWEHRSTTERLS